MGSDPFTGKIEELHSPFCRVKWPKIKMYTLVHQYTCTTLDFYFYLSQTVSDPYSEFLAIHWAKGVTWEAYVLSIIHFAQKHTGTSRS